MSDSVRRRILHHNPTSLDVLTHEELGACCRMLVQSPDVHWFIAGFRLETSSAKGLWYTEYPLVN